MKEWGKDNKERKIKESWKGETEIKEWVREKNERRTNKLTSKQRNRKNEQINQKTKRKWTNEQKKGGTNDELNQSYSYSPMIYIITFDMFETRNTQTSTQFLRTLIKHIA